MFFALQGLNAPADITDSYRLEAWQKLAELPPDQFFQKADPHHFCPDFQKESTAELLFELTFQITGNIITNNVWGYLYPGFLKGAELITNMHVQDARLRLYLLGATIHHQNVAKENIPVFVQNVGEDLQNPITKSPFGWNAEKEYLYFPHPRSSVDMKFHIKFSE